MVKTKKPKNAPQAFTYRGQQYLSLRQAADQLEIKYSTLRARLQRGCSIKEALDTGASAHKVVVGGKTYKALTKACENLSFDVEMIYSRLKYGWSIDQAFELDPPPFLGPGIMGFIYKITNNSNAKVYIGMTRATIEERWRWHLNAALTKVVNSDGLHAAIRTLGADAFAIEILERCKSVNEMMQRERTLIQELNTLAPNGYNLGIGGEGHSSLGIEVECDGVRYDSLMSAARANEINYGTLRDRIDNGWTIEEALKTSIGEREKTYHVNGKTFPSRKSLARELGISEDLIRHRERNGESIEAIIAHPKRRYREEPIACCVREFASKKEFAEFLGVNSSTLGYHLKREGSAEGVCKKFKKCRVC